MKYYCKKTRKIESYIVYTMKAGSYYEEEYNEFCRGKIHKYPWAIYAECEDGYNRWVELTEFQFSKTFNVGSRKEKLKKLSWIN